MDIGDQVAATDPATGRTGPRSVELLHRNRDTDLADVTVATKDGSTVLHTTQHHPFWDRTLGEWVDAANLAAGHQLRTLDGDVVTVVEVRNFTGGMEMRDLTVAGVHTYYVLAAGEPVLVHNCDPEDLGPHEFGPNERNTVGYRYQEHVTGADYEQWYRHGGKLVKPDGGPNPHGYLVEAKWTGDDSAGRGGWEGSFYNPSNRFNERATVGQAQKLLDLNRALGGKGVRYAVSNVEGAAFFKAVLREWFPDQMASGELGVFHVPIDGMRSR